MARIILRRLERHTPALLTGVQIQILLNLTARAFHTPKRSVWRLPPGEALGRYAELTRHCMGGDPDRLYREAFRLGVRLRRITGFTDSADIEMFALFEEMGLRPVVTPKLLNRTPAALQEPSADTHFSLTMIFGIGREDGPSDLGAVDKMDAATAELGVRLKCLPGRIAPSRFIDFPPP